MKLIVRILQSFGEFRPNQTTHLDAELARALAGKRMVEIIGGEELPPANATLNIVLPPLKASTGQEAPADGKSANEGEPKSRRGTGRIKAVHGSGDATVPAAGGEPGEGSSTG